MHHFRQWLFSARRRQAFFLIGLLAFGCAHPSERTHPQFSSHRQSMGVLLVLPPEIRILEQLPDGGLLYQAAESLEAQQNALSSIVRELRARAFSVRTMDRSMSPGVDIDELTRLFRSVNHSIQLHTFGPQIYPAKLNAFEYSLGSVADLLEAAGADGLVMAIGFQAGADKPNKNWFGLAVIEPRGNVIWYNLTSNPDQFNFQRTTDVSALVTRTMHHFWERGS